jgi:hypothetical protein
MQVSRAAATYLLINNAYAGAKTIKQIMLIMDPIDETAEDQALSNTRKKALRQEERLLDEIAIEDKVDKKNQMADAGVLILQGQDDGIRCTYLDGTTGVKCVGENACKNVVIADIPCGSCLGVRSCYGLTGTVGEDSCAGLRACYKAKDMTIGKESCTDYRACYEAENTTIANSACRGYEACWNVKDMTIAIESCNGYESCYFAERSTIGVKSCNDKMACYGIVDMTIADHSCRGYKACYEAESTTILARSCIGTRVCEYMIGSAVGIFSCIGDFACDVYGSSGYYYFDNDHTIIVGNDSCFGTKSCFDIDPAGKEFANRF